MAGSKNNPAHQGGQNNRPPANRTLIDITIPSDFTASRDVERQVQAALAAMHYTPESFFAIKLSLEEALLNAIRHGNREDRSKHVHIRISMTPQRTEIIIEDQGKGFDRSRVPDPRLDENLEKCTGRGILLIESYMNKVQWTQNGRRLRMVRKNDHTPPAA